MGDSCGWETHPHPPFRGLTGLLSARGGSQGCFLVFKEGEGSLPSAHSSSPDRKSLLLSVSPSASEMGTDVDNEINKQLQDKLNRTGWRLLHWPGHWNQVIGGLEPLPLL